MTDFFRISANAGGHEQIVEVIIADIEGAIVLVLPLQLVFELGGPVDGVAVSPFSLPL